MVHMNQPSYPSDPEHEREKEQIFQAAAELIKSDPTFRLRIQALLQGVQQEEGTFSTPLSSETPSLNKGGEPGLTFLDMPIRSPKPTLNDAARQSFISKLIVSGFRLSYRELSILAKQIEARNHQPAEEEPAKKPGFFARFMGRPHQKTSTQTPQRDISYHQLFEQLWVTSERKQSQYTLREIFEHAGKYHMLVFKTGEEANHQAKARRYEEKF